jgi:hypothetical protein
MLANRFNGYTNYGVGIGLRVPHLRPHPLKRSSRRDQFQREGAQ